MTKIVTFSWFRESRHCTWAETPAEVPEWDFSRGKSSGLLNWPQHMGSRTWEEHKAIWGMVIKSPPEQGYPRLVNSPQPSKTKKDGYVFSQKATVFSQLASIHQHLEKPNSMQPGSMARKKISEIANAFTPYVINAGDDSTTLESWVSAIHETHAILKMLADLQKYNEDDPRVILEELENCLRKSEVEHQTLLRLWRRVETCNSSVDLRERLWHHCWSWFGRGHLNTGFIVQPMKVMGQQELVFGVHAGVGRWAMYELANHIELGGKLYICPNCGVPYSPPQDRSSNCGKASCKQALHRAKNKIL